MAAKKVVKIARDAGNGRFVPMKQAKAKPGTTVVETIKRKP